MPQHIPVMVEEAVSAGGLGCGSIVVDATFGAGGYSERFLDRGAHVIAFDRDPGAVEIARAHGLAEREGFRLHTAPFSSMSDFVDEAFVDAVVMDIGVSSMQLDEAARGFSFMRDGPLDMRMGGTGPTAADVVNGLRVNDLIRVIGLLGEERHAPKVAHAIDRARGEAPITTTKRLAEIVGKAVPRGRGDTIHPATRTFQGIRIYVNDELNELAKGLHAAERCLRPGGHLVVVTFHSLEDRIVKRFISERSGRTGGSRHVPQVAVSEPTFEPVGKQGIGPTKEERARNPRARSARLRCARRLDAASTFPAPKPVHDLPSLEQVGAAR